MPFRCLAHGLRKEACTALLRSASGKRKAAMKRAHGAFCWRTLSGMSGMPWRSSKVFVQVRQFNQYLRP